MRSMRGTMGAGLLLCAALAWSGPAAALSLVPQMEGEVDVGLAGPLGGGSFLTVDFAITSLVDSSSGSRSRLFVDRSGTANTYDTVQFLSQDVGTSEGTGQYWFRPVQMDPWIADGQLETGTFEITFASTIAELAVRLFDVESPGTSYAVNGGSAVGVTPGANHNIVELLLSNVDTLVLDLGEYHGEGFTNGDGVLFQMDSGFPPAPEPSSVGLLALAAGTGLALRRRRR